MIHVVGQEGINNREIPRGMKIYPKKFNRISYYEHLEIVHLFDTMHIRKNVIETLWKILDGRKYKATIVNICNDIKEVNMQCKA